MRIIHFISSDKISGLEILSMSILKELSLNHEVYYSCPNGEGIKHAAEMGIGTIVCNTRNRKDIKRVCKEYKPDIVHAHDPAVSLTCALAGIKFISHLHCNCEWMPKLCPNSIALLLVCLKAKKIICVSESILNEYVFKNAMKRKAVVLNNYVDRDNVVNAATEECGEQYDICFVGRLTSHKQPLKFLEVVEKICKSKTDIKAVMIGDGELKSEVEKAIVEKKLSNNVFLKGFEINPHKYVNKSKVGVLTSSNEGFGLVAVEAMILSKPFVAFPVGGIPNIVNNENGKLCDDADDMADEIVRLLTDTEYYEAKSAKAEQSSHKFTDKNAYVKEILKIYNEK